MWSLHDFHPGHVLGCDHESLALALVGEDARETDDAIAHHDVDVRRPGLLAQFGKDSVAKDVIGFRRRLDFLRHACQGVHQIRAAHDPDEFSVFNDRQALDAAPLHHIDDLFK